MSNRTFKRTEMLLGEEAMEKLAAARVAVFGIGGVGGYVVEGLARSGIGALDLIDSDLVEESNLNRQLLCTENELGREKAVVAAERIHAINGNVEVEPVVTYLGEANAAALFYGADCVVDCLDNLEARFWAAHACQNLGIPIVYGAIAGWFGQVCTVYPGDPSFACAYGEPFESGGESQRESRQRSS